MLQVKRAPGFRMTRQRKEILEELRKVTTHPSADEVYAMVKKRIPQISLGTVYRNLEVLAEMGEIQKIRMGGAQNRFDGNAMNHYHMRCLKCDRVMDAPVQIHDALSRALDGVEGFTAVGHRVEFIGYCSKCGNGKPPVAPKE